MGWYVCRLASRCELDVVLKRLRAAGLSPVAEDALGGVIVEERREHHAAAPDSPIRSTTRLGAAELAQRLLADPSGDNGFKADRSDLLDQLAGLNPDAYELETILLAAGRSALRHGRSNKG